MKYLRKTVEFGFSATLLSTLLLTACGGGGGSAAVGGGATGTSVTLTPVKGKFEGKCVVSIRNTAGATLFTGTQTINANGTTTVTLAAGSTGPYLVSIQGDATGTQCLYFNDDAANPRLMPMSATESLNALVSTNDLAAASGVAITSLSEMAYQAASAIHGGHLRNLTESSPEIAQGIAAAVTLAGLTGASAVASIFTPPRAIPASGVAANDDMGRTLVNIANINATKPMDAIRLMSYHAQSAVGAPPSASAVAALSPLNFVGQGQAFGLRLQTNTQTAALNAARAATSAALLNDITTTGLRRIGFGFRDLTTGMGNMADGTLITATVANAIYTITNIFHLLSPTGTWTLTNKPPSSFTQNPDGSLNLVQSGVPTAFNISQVNLTGTSFASAVPFAMNNNNLPTPNPMGVLGTNGQLILSNGVPTASNVPPVGVFTSGVLYQMMPVSGVATQGGYLFNAAAATQLLNAVKVPVF